jgi:phenylacetate-CoA ligase
MNYLKILKDLYRLKKNVKLSAGRMRSLQEKKLRRLLRLAWEHSAYYRAAFENAGIAKKQLDTLPLSCFPAIDKQALLEHFDELVTVPDLKQEDLRKFDAEEATDRKPYQGKYHVVHSSGSTGKPGYFVYDEDAWNQMLLGIIRAALWDMSMPRILRLLMKRPKIVYIAATDGRYGGAMAVGDGIDGVGAEQMYLDIKTPVAEWIRQIREFRPNIVIGYPSAIKILAQLMEKGDVAIDIQRVISCGEPLNETLRKYLEKVFQTTIVNIYGASESLALGVETDPEKGMVLFDDLNLIEVENGVMYLTCLYNYTQPLIRYRLLDHLTLEAAREGEPPFTRAVGLLGRNDDVLWFENRTGEREFLHPLAIEGFCIEGLKDYQFRQTTKDTFEMYAETDSSASREYIRQEMLHQMRKILKEKKLEYVQFYVNFVDMILPDKKTGKKPLISASNEPSAVLARTFGECRESQQPAGQLA